MVAGTTAGKYGQKEAQTLCVAGNPSIAFNLAYGMASKMVPENKVLLVSSLDNDLLSPYFYNFMDRRSQVESLDIEQGVLRKTQLPTLNLFFGTANMLNDAIKDYGKLTELLNFYSKENSSLKTDSAKRSYIWTIVHDEFNNSDSSFKQFNKTGTQYVFLDKDDSNAQKQLEMINYALFLKLREDIAVKFPDSGLSFIPPPDDSVAGLYEELYRLPNLTSEEKVELTAQIDKTSKHMKVHLFYLPEDNELEEEAKLTGIPLLAHKSNRENQLYERASKSTLANSLEKLVLYTLTKEMSSPKEFEGIIKNNREYFFMRYSVLERSDQIINSKKEIEKKYSLELEKRLETERIERIENEKKQSEKLSKLSKAQNKTKLPWKKWAKYVVFGLGCFLSGNLYRGCNLLDTQLKNSDKSFYESMSNLDRLTKKMESIIKGQAEKKAREFAEEKQELEKSTELDKRVQMERKLTELKRQEKGTIIFETIQPQKQIQAQKPKPKPAPKPKPLTEEQKLMLANQKTLKDPDFLSDLENMIGEDVINKDSIVKINGNELVIDGKESILTYNLSNSMKALWGKYLKKHYNSIKNQR